VFIRRAHRVFVVPTSYAADIDTGQEHRASRQSFAADLIDAFLTIKLRLTNLLFNINMLNMVARVQLHTAANHKPLETG